MGEFATPLQILQWNPCSKSLRKTSLTQYSLISELEQRSLCHAPRAEITEHCCHWTERGPPPLRKGSILDCLIMMQRTDGCFESSAAMSCSLRWTEGSYSSSLGTVIFPAQRNVKKHKHDASHIIYVSYSSLCGDHASFNLVRISGDMGRRCLLSPPFSASTLLISLIT